MCIVFLIDIGSVLGDESVDVVLHIPCEYSKWIDLGLQCTTKLSQDMTQQRKSSCGFREKDLERTKNWSSISGHIRRALDNKR